MKEFPLIVIASVVVRLVQCQSPPTRQPNIIFIMTDDHAYQAISAYGSILMETPQIDKLARRLTGKKRNRHG